jgi:hypothetical protein
MQQFVTEFPETMKSGNLTFGLAQCGWSGERLTHGLAVYFAGQTIVGAMAGFARLMAVTVGLSTAAADGRNGSAAEIAQFENLAQDDGSSLFEIDKSLRHAAPPIPDVSIR